MKLEQYRRISALLSRVNFGQLMEMEKELVRDLRGAGMTREEATDFADACFTDTVSWIRENRTV